VITALSWWWMATPFILLTPVIAPAVGLPWVREELGWMFVLVALSSAMVVPTLGLVVASVWHRRRARARFTIMGTVSSVPVLFFWVFGTLLAECPDGYHC